MIRCVDCGGEEGAQRREQEKLSLRSEQANIKEADIWRD